MCDTFVVLAHLQACETFMYVVKLQMFEMLENH